MFSLLLQVPEEQREMMIAELWDAGAVGITEEEESLKAFFGPEADAWALMQHFSSARPKVQREEDRDWVQIAQNQWEPFEVGERFYLVPEWRDDPAPVGRLRLTMHPGMACGSGTHPATRLCLMAIERHVKPGEHIIDVGTGAGILADAARLLGAGPIVACDIEHDASKVARGNLDTSVSVFTGSARSIKSEAFDWAVCNLNAATLSALRADLVRIATHLILSGFTEDETDKVAGTFKRAVREQMELDGYGCLVL